VLDARLEPVPVGSAGELCLGGAGIARGYLGRPSATAAVFVPDPFAARRPDAGGRLYRTGDLARVRPDGAIEFLGRTDDQVKIRGFRIEPGEVEAALAGHPEVREVAVVAREVGGDRRLIAYLAPRDGEEPPAADALAEWLHERLPAYMVPAAFVSLAELPLTPTGKVDRERLPEPAPDAVTGERAPYLAPRTPAEEALAAIWSDVLEVERVGVDDDFFRLGGHSLLATRVISRVRDRVGVELPLRALFEARTVAALAPRLGAAVGGTGLARSGDRPGPVLPPIGRLERREEPALADVVVRAPLSFAQQRLWFLDRLEPGRAIYNVPAAIRLETGGVPLDTAALRQALEAIVRRHEALRTSFTIPSRVDASPGGAREPLQLVHGTAVVPFRHHDLTGLARAPAAAEAARLGALEGNAPFDLEHGPLVRFRLLSLPGCGPAPEHRLLVTFHHVVADGWSIDVFLRELRVLYRGQGDAPSAEAVRAAQSALPDLPVQPADHAAWQRETLQGETLGELLSFWRKALEGAPQVIELPLDRPRPPVPSYRGERCYFRVGGEVTEGLARMAGEAGASRFMTLLATWQVLLARLCGSGEMVVGSPVAGRDRAELEGLIGLFVNTLVLRGRVAPATPFRDYLETVRETCLDAFAHAALPFERLVEELEPERSLAHNPLFQVLFSFQSSGLLAAARDGAAGGRERGSCMRPILLSNYNGTARVDLALDLWEDQGEHRGGLTGYLEYASDLFDRSTAERLVEWYRRLLAAVAAEPERPIGSQPLLSAAERHQMVAEWNATARPPAAEATLHDLVRERIRATPDAEALLGPEDPVTGRPERLTYAELGRRVGLLARHLRRLGVGPETPVGLFVERSVRMVVGMLGVLEAGGAYVPLDPSFPVERLSAMVEDADLALVLTEEALVDRLPWRVSSSATRPEASTDRRVLRLDADWPEIEAAGEGEGSVGSPPSAVAPDQLAYMIFTSGSTGRPKGVQISHRAAVNFLRSMAVAPGLGQGDTLLAVTTLSFDIALLELLLPLIVSGRVAIASSAEARAGDELARRIAKVAPTAMQATPATWRMLVDLPGATSGREGGAVPPPAKVLCGGEALPRELAERLLDRGLELWNLYGPTETTVWSAALRMEPGAGPVPVGGPIDNTSLHVLDPLCPEAEPAPIGVAGELAIGGAGLARGYLGRPAMTAERFRPDPFAGLHSSGGARMYRTGDLVRRRPDGTIHFLGRLDHQVKVRGYRIELGEIEAALRRHPAVLQAVAEVRDDGDGGPGGRRLVAYVVPESTVETTVPELRAVLEQSLPGYMVPSAFVLLDALPLTPNGKVDRRALPAPDGDRAGLADGFVAPRTAVEEDLVAIWRQVLGLERVGIRDNFFTLGGHSLLATQVMTRVEEAFGREAPVRLLFEAPTIEALAERLVDSGLGDMDQEALARALDEIESLTEDELEALLASGRPADRAG